ncbi:hypothetical protein BXP70_26400 [Hymenobacter crusticola]|uniref:Uncharacterized protein n=1 Tax=Hymenobacter crusticola TaxID=1770526 RepID=A0A243W8E1_9BACT|nr:hypothetical protein BXP70_26400 [Hymenobacter crusticola]
MPKVMVYKVKQFTRDYAKCNATSALVLVSSLNRKLYLTLHYPYMKLPKALLGAMLVGITVHATSCTKNGDPQPKSERGEKNGKETAKTPVNCPACGMG